VRPPSVFCTVSETVRWLPLGRVTVTSVCLEFAL
jgi:hypothetical protein